MGNCFGSSRSVVPEPIENHAIEQTGPHHQPRKHKSVATHVVGVDDDYYGVKGKTNWPCERGLKPEEKLQAERCEPWTMDEDERRATEKHDGDGGDGRVLSVRLVVTQRELQRIMEYQKYAKFSSVEQVLSAIRLANGGEPTTSSWRPSLDTIPEDHCFDGLCTSSSYIHMTRSLDL